VQQVFQKFSAPLRVITYIDDEECPMVNTTPTATSNSSSFLQDNNGNNSAIRLMCFMALITAIGFGSYTLVNSKDVGPVGTNLTFAFLAAAFGGKVAHKFAENSSQ
jgi:hypothetical protein